MSSYRFLEDHSIGSFYYPAGTTAATADVGGTLPAGWTPTPNVDPLDAPAVAAFFAQGPVKCGPVIAQWSYQSVGPPVTYWAKQSNGEYALTGLGSALSPLWPWRI
jgi:hypothetical protein